ncbi:MAG: hypothetical protein WC623_21220 [Pedobacter sp.]|uniref:hypothetical protein n=1 Tax=Pedobacter sp. TaxID=1411316 RepID=UPI00356A9BCE
METIKIALMLLLSYTAVFAQQYNNSGWLSVTLNSVACQGKATDDALNFDGWGNEVYIVTFYSIASANGATKASWRTVSKVYGDVNRFPDRIKAGELNPDRVSGGLQKGSQFFPGAEYSHLKKMKVESTDFLTVIPTIWEWDNNSNSSVQAKFEERMLYAFHAINLKLPQLMQHCYGDYKCYDITNGLGAAKPSFKDILEPVNGTTGSRPIGMSTDGEYYPFAFTISGKMLQVKDNSGFNNTHAMSNLEFAVNEESLGNTRDKGAYWFRFNTSYEIDVTKPNVPPPAQTQAQGTFIRPVNANLPISNRANINHIVPNYLIGKWQGIQTTDSGQYPQGIQFELTANKEFIIMAGSALAAKGNYQFTNNQFTGSYKLLSSGETISFNGNYDTATKKLSFTLGSGTATTGQGKAEVSKQ